MSSSEAAIARARAVLDFEQFCAQAIYLRSRADNATDSDERRHYADRAFQAENRARSCALKAWPNTDPEDWPLDGKEMLEMAGRLDAGVI